MPTVKFDDYLEKRFQDPELRSNFEAESLRLESAVALLKAREDAGLTQRELAKRVDVPQSTIARIERGNNTSVDTLSKIANALGKKLKVEFVNM
ncbi:helix-turn-helix transcriptional regulator [Ligilactobacillus murinus]|uniref:Helix-turn-helix transcriptional regulator n=1 Tax=Ligilactobacillus murinus TaxID=1622 RepID=A0A2Z4W0X6_9LACO|nr:helix-turn-helix transcriptional regulator [Ligilactobacillus murinus]MDE7024210.1 helix-turn-helix domain-containing protein [Ligilactobacillus sp.]NBH85209.1 XRE family transcriptional regulator [Lachnospiraceae bacterium]HBV48915.1 XRE family transcriptional regulator [Lactobacillus sp.]AWZ37890.1 XRE family transcriptional regulator [Ligilactobacillus murinus]AWZ41119.1 XRE family transcriptional regulator [Ligilactobacillus murinus]